MSLTALSAQCRRPPAGLFVAGAALHEDKDAISEWPTKDACRVVVLGCTRFICTGRI